MSPGHAIGIDVGGSSVKLGLVGPDGLIATAEPIPLHQAQPFPQFAADLGDAVEALVTRHAFRAAAIGIGTPGFPDQATGRLLEGGHNVRPMHGGSLPQALRERFGTPAFIENDGICAAMGELRFGDWGHCPRFAVAAVGTGVGGALIIDGRIVTGRGGLPPEFGAISLDPDLPAELGPVPGRLDRLGSAAALVRRYRALQPEAPESVTAQGIVALAERGDPAAAQSVDATARYLAQAFGILANIANLDAIVMGGGIAGSGFFRAAVAAHLESFVWPSAFRTPRLVAAKHGNAAGLLGAAAFALERVQAEATDAA